MLLMGKELRVIHVTTHVALRRVPELVTRERVARDDPARRRGRCGISGSRARASPCAGSIPTPARTGSSATRSRWRSVPRSPTRAREGIDATGPYPADTLMSRARGAASSTASSPCTTIRGTRPVKALGFSYDEAKKAWTGLSGVNVTVGLPDPPRLGRPRHRLRPRGDRARRIPRAWSRRSSSPPRWRGAASARRPGLTVPHYRIAVIAGDGIGPEVVAEAMKVLHAVAVPGRLDFAFEGVEAGAGVLPAHRRGAAARDAGGVPGGGRHPLRRRGASRRPLPGRNRDSAPAHAPHRSRPLRGPPADPAPSGRADAAPARRGRANRLRHPPGEHRGALRLARRGRHGRRPRRDRHARRHAPRRPPDLPAGVRAGAPRGAARPATESGG